MADPNLVCAKTQQEIEALSPVEREQYFESQRRTVFGADYKVDKQGRPIESGIGSPGRETVQHRQALERQAARNRMSGVA